MEPIKPEESKETALAMLERVDSLMRGFMESRITLTAIELDLFSMLGNGASAREVARKLKTGLRPAEVLLNALAALKLLDKKDGMFFNTPLTARFLAANSPDSARDALMHMVHLWDRWSTLTRAVRQGKPIAFKPMRRRSSDTTVAFIAAMHKNATIRAAMTVNAIDLAGVNRLLDLGGGSGALAIAFARKKPETEVTVFDLANVIPLTRKYIAEAGLQDRIKTLAGDMQKDKLGRGYDLVVVSQICHMFSPQENLRLFKKVRAALASAGRIAILDFVLNDDKTEPRQGAVFAVNMLVNTRGGSTYSGKEYSHWLKSAGFIEPRVSPLPGPIALVTAARP